MDDSDFRRRPATSGGAAGATPPAPTLPKGGGAIQGIGEKFAANPVNGTGSLSVPLGTSPGRSGFGPQLSLTYDSGAGNGPFGFGWFLLLPGIARKSGRGLPQYRDAEESDVYLLAGAEDLVPLLQPDGTRFADSASVPGFAIHRYRPRIEGSFARIERWTDAATGEIHWRSLSPDNVTTLYGRDGNSRIFDPAGAGPARIFEWLPCQSFDDKGNVIVYEYAAEDDRNVDLARASERNRLRPANRYLKRVRYGNRVSRLVEPDPSKLDWLFEVVFDYEEGHYEDAGPGPAPREGGQVRASAAKAGDWTARPDPFSSHRAGFEVRTHRRCRRVLMFHRFAELGPEPCLVSATELGYDDLAQPLAIEDELAYPGSTRRGSFLRQVTRSGFIRDESQGVLERGGARFVTYLRKSLPPLAFEYSQAVIQDDVRELDAESLENLPAGVDEGSCQWVDLNGEGLSGILTEQAGAWYYKPNLGGGRFGPLEAVAARPSLADLSGGRQALLDVAGDGHLDLADFAGPVPGFFKRAQDGGWELFKPFSSLPNLSWDEPNLRFVDLDGDGRADLLLTEDDAFTWYPSLAEEGFGPARRVPQATDEERGPRLVLADGTQSIYLADMCGDGLADLVRVRNGEVCYWPNQGYGRFGAKVTMDGAPWLDHPDRFDQRRVRLADLDGSGVTDIVYLGRDGVSLYFNESGNGWSAPRRLRQLPPADRFSSISAVDLLGNGTACLVWSSPLPGESRRPVRYIDLMGGQKPNLLVRSINNLGAETRVQYTASTKLYLADKLAGKPWITRLPFPVHVVEKVEHVDLVSRTRFTSSYSYHHGYFDGAERELRGFARVDRQDTEAFEDYVTGAAGGAQEQAPELYQPPIVTRTWFHTGAFLDGDRILHQLRDEYFLRQQHTPEPLLPAGMDEHELRECLRALKGLPLRQEVYSFDGSPREANPYSVVESNYELKRLQPRAGQRHAVFLACGSETVTHSYERNPADPRITHSFTLETGPYGNALKSASVVYGRKIADPALPAEVTRDQQRSFITYGETDYTPDIDQAAPRPAYRLRTPCETRGYEITGVAPASGLFTPAEIRSRIAGAAAIDYEVVADGVSPQKRLLSTSRTLFRDDALAPLPLGQWDTLGLGYESYRLAFTPGVTSAWYAGNVSDADFTAAGYVHWQGDANWWIPSGTAVYPPDPASRFYRPIGGRDPLGLETIATLDSYGLLAERVQVTQAAWNDVRIANDYRVLGPVMLTDPNRNRTAVEIDALGMVVKSAVMGKAGAREGDTLADPTVRLEYELFRWIDQGKPNFSRLSAREKHGPANPRWQESYTYSNGSGGVAMVKAQAHAGKALRANPDGRVEEVDADPRWVGNGRTVLNNKGNPVKQYQPYFSTTPEYEDESALREIGATALVTYDALGRNVRTDLPDGTLTRVELGAWMRRELDANDAVLESQWYADRGSPDPATQPEPVNDPDRRAAWLAAKHAGTPGTVHFDSLGRALYAVSDYGGGTQAAVRSEIDLTGRFVKVFDPRQRQAASSFTGMASTPIASESAEKGRRTSFLDVLGGLVRTWDEPGRRFRAEYDELHRPVATYVREPGNPEILFNYVVQGDRHPDAEALNLRGTAHQVFDTAGMLRVQALDFKGNPLSVERLLAHDYKSTPDWSALATQPGYAAIQTAAGAALETGEPFVASSLYDALSRPAEVTLHGGTILKPVYNEANFLASLQARIQGSGPFVEFLKGQDYDAKGQRQLARYGNDVLTQYFYDPRTFRLSHLLTTRPGDPAAGSLQDLHYTYDALGNITQIRDDAQPTNFFSNAVVKAEALFEYDALYQLIKASGREHAALANDSIRDDRDIDFVPQLPHPNDAAAVRAYTELYEYDLLGNLLRMRHTLPTNPSGPGNWTRNYHYFYQDDPADRTNRLASTSRRGDPEAGPYTATYSYDPYGNMTRLRLPSPNELVWSFLDQLQQADLGGGGKAFYVYGMGGQRIRKVIERRGTLRIERIYFGAVEIYRERLADGEPYFERRTLHISDGTGRIAQVDVKVRDDDGSDPANPLGTPLIRYQYGNHLGSAVLETDAAGTVISYEEYHPFGTTAYRSARPGADLSLKRYRFSGKERDDETGLYYYGARYYAPWLGRWTSADPAGLIDGLNLFRFARNNPVMLVDPSGLDSVTVVQKRHFTGHESFEEIRSLAAQVPGYQLDPEVNAENFTSRYLPGGEPGGEGGVWNVMSMSPPDYLQGSGDSSGPAPPAGGTDTSAAPPPPEPAAVDSTPAPTGPGAGGTALSLTPAVAERFIWDYSFPGTGVAGSQRGRILEWMYGVPWRDNTEGIDVITETAIKQIKSTNDYSKVGNITRSATRDSARFIADNPAASVGRRPQAVIITPTDVPPQAVEDIGTALNPGRGRRIPAGALPPEHVRGLPGRTGTFGTGLSVLGTGLSVYSLYRDYEGGDLPMGVGDLLGTVGGGLELAALATGAAVAGVSLMSAGLVVGGAGIAVSSAVSAYRSYQAGDQLGVAAGVVGVGAGLAIMAGLIFGAPLLLAGGLLAALAVGLFHLGRWLFS